MEEEELEGRMGKDMVKLVDIGEEVDSERKGVRGRERERGEEMRSRSRKMRVWQNGSVLTGMKAEEEKEVRPRHRGEESRVERKVKKRKR